VNEYEILLMLDPELAEERQTEIVTRTKELVEKGSGSWLSHDVWGRRRLAYEIDHKTDGAYHLLQFDVEPATLDEIARVLKITDGVMRHMATRRVKGGGTRTAPPPLPPSEAAPQRYEREAPAPAPVTEEAEAPAEETEAEAVAEETAAAPAEPETDVAEPEAEEYPEPTESVESEAPETAPEEEN
jgi:small subunit ribosomal protein S6